MKWWVWVLIAYFVLQSQQPAQAASGTATATGTIAQPGYTGGFGLNLIF